MGGDVLREKLKYKDEYRKSTRDTVIPPLGLYTHITKSLISKNAYACMVINIFNTIAQK